MAKLDLITVASPCSASWEAMDGDDRVRHCKLCHLDVYDLSNMRRDEAEAFVEANEGQACVRFLQRADGTVITEDCATRRETPPRPCVPAPVRPTVIDGDRAMAAKPRPPTMKMGKMVMPPPEAEPDPVDERLSAGTILADVVRAVRSTFESREGELLVRELEKLVTPPPKSVAAKCARGGCALWIPEEKKERFIDGIDECELRMQIVEKVRASVTASFEESRSTLLLRELSRHPFAYERGPCPHCKRQIRAPGALDF